MTYVATFSFSNKSLTLPPATLRNAELQHPVIKRNIRKTTGNIASVGKVKADVESIDYQYL